MPYYGVGGRSDRNIHFFSSHLCGLNGQDRNFDRKCHHSLFEDFFYHVYVRFSFLEKNISHAVGVLQHIDAHVLIVKKKKKSCCAFNEIFCNTLKLLEDRYGAVLEEKNLIFTIVKISNKFAINMVCVCVCVCACVCC